MFAVVGFAAGIVGTATSNGLLAVRKQLDKNFVSQNEAPNVLLNAGTWATHMGVSSNVRYQILNGIDMVRTPVPHALLVCGHFVDAGMSMMWQSTLMYGHSCRGS